VDVRLTPARDGLPTARSYILITPDGQRTMQTYLGACTELSVADITPETVGKPEILLVEGYVWDLPEGPALLEKAIRLAKAGGARIALSLSDSFCVDRHRGEFMETATVDADIVFADDDEVMALFDTDDFSAVERMAAGFGKLFVMTRSEQGSVIVQGDLRIQQAAIRVPKVVDTTGAGDAYTAGFLHGLAKGKPLEVCAWFATECATAVIQQVGARIEKGLLTL
jgi:adenosine kinase